MRTYKGQYASAYYCTKCRKMFFVPSDAVYYVPNCPYCGSSGVRTETSRIMVRPDIWDEEKTFMVTIPSIKEV